MILRLFVLLLLLSGLTASAFSQDKKPLSPPMTLEAQVGTTELKIQYNAPSKRGRTLWGDLIPYAQIWRTGANAATKITIDNNIKINGKLLPAGRYSIFSIPDEKVWTIIFNSVADQWGHYNYDASKDVLRVETIPEIIDTSHEQMAFAWDNDTLMLTWDRLRISLLLTE